VGLYGVLSYSVRQRTRELGLRSALGAKAGRLVGAVVGHGLGLASIGVVAGMVIGLVAARALRSQLFNVAPADPITWAGAAAVTLSVAALASVLPSIRAARVDPVVALREE
jgi:putative ABC transport system permease protein